MKRRRGALYHRCSVRFCFLLKRDVGRIKVAKRLTALHASARRGLEGMYAAWLLVFARRQEINQINTQTGRIGEDDASYFPAPNIGWYDDAMFSYSNAQSKKM